MNQREMNKYLGKIKEEWRNLFICSLRTTSAVGKPVLLIAHDQFENFLVKLRDDDEIQDEEKILYGLLISGGLRVSEALAIQRQDLDVDNDGNLFLTIKCLKKKKPVTREIIVHPVISPLVKKHLLSKRGFERLFGNLRRTAAINRLKRTFAKDFTDCEGLDLHAFKHAAISRLLFGLNYSTEKVSQIQRLSPKIISAYSHLNMRGELKEIFGGGKAA